VHPTTLLGPDYSQLRFNMTAGNPVYAPIPMRKLLDVQPCAETEPYQPATARPFWKDFRDMVWARAAGEMQVLYYYPLQRSFPLPGGAGAVGQCVPWMEQLASGTLSNTQDVRVLPVTYNVAWPTLAPLLTVGETVYERSKNGISGVAEQAAVAKIYDDLAPGRWDNRAEKIVIGGVETVANLAQLIDPLSAVSEDVDIRIDGNPSLPAAIKTERLLYGGGMALVGTTDNEITLPFALRSRVLFDDATGKLIFRGYYDGVSPEYIKGDPLLLLNVMSQADRTRLQSLCPTDSVPPYYDDTDCGKYNYAVNALYWKSHNPRQVDLCRTDIGLIWENGSQAGNHDLLMLQNRIADAQRSDRNFSFEEYNAACPAGASRDLQPDWDFLIAVQDADDNGLPEAYEGLGKGKALSAGNAAGTGYVTLVYNNDASLGGLPVSLQVLQVGCTLDDSRHGKPLSRQPAGDQVRQPLRREADFAPHGRLRRPPGKLHLRLVHRAGGRHRGFAHGRAARLSVAGMDQGGAGDERRRRRDHHRRRQPDDARGQLADHALQGVAGLRQCVSLQRLGGRPIGQAV
jgi:hypothetical protein